MLKPAQTAYFEISRDVAHGQHLYCSHPICRAAGVKFRYCLHCKKPVTKQNFRSRHLHAEFGREKETSRKTPTGKKRKLELAVADLDSIEEGEDDQASGSEGGLNVHNVIERDSQPATVLNRLVDPLEDERRQPIVLEQVSSTLETSPMATALVVSSGIQSSDGEGLSRRFGEQEKDVEQGGGMSEKRRGRVTDPEERHGWCSAECTTRASDSIGKKSLETRDESMVYSMYSTGDNRPNTESDTFGDIQIGDRTRRWVSLLAKRPQNLGGMGAWITQVLFVSDKSRTWNFDGEGNHCGDEDESPNHEEFLGSSTKEKELFHRLANWKSLLEKRPDTANGSIATAWLMRVLEVSCTEFHDDSMAVEF